MPNVAAVGKVAAAEAVAQQGALKPAANPGAMGEAWGVR